MQLPADLKLVVFDFDGVLTDNRLYMAADGSESVAVNCSDGLGIVALKEAGVAVLILSADSSYRPAARAKKLGVDCLRCSKDKLADLSVYLRARGWNMAQMVYVGNDANDAMCMKLAGCAFHPADAHRTARIGVELRRPGGHGAAREVCDYVLEHIERIRGNEHGESGTDRG